MVKPAAVAAVAAATDRTARLPSEATVEQVTTLQLSEVKRQAQLAMQVVAAAVAHQVVLVVLAEAATEPQQDQ
jgi:hypothetical protein